MMDIFSIFLLVSICSNVLTLSTDDTTCSREELIFHRLSNTKLDVPFQFILLNKTVMQPEDCFGTCQNQPLCRSFNALKIDKNRIQCQFVKFNQFHVPSKRLSTNVTSTYFEINQMSSCNIKPLRDCSEIYEQGMQENGMYTIHVHGKHHQVLCDMETGPFGYTVFQKRSNGVEGFMRNWTEFKKGFGKVENGFWLGNDLIHMLACGNRNELRVDLKYQKKRYFAVYDEFYVANEAKQYELTVGGYQSTGTAGDSFFYHSGSKFSTYDNNNDQNPTMWSCSKLKGGFWFKNCQRANLNGIFGNYSNNGINWNSITSGNGGITETEMKIRRITYIP